MASWKLIDVKTGAELNVGDVRLTFRGDEVRITSLQPPHKPESSGKVNVKFVSDGVPGQYYPGVLDARFVEADDGEATEKDDRKIDRLLGEFFRPKGAQ